MEAKVRDSPRRRRLDFCVEIPVIGIKMFHITIMMPGVEKYFYTASYGFDYRL